MTINQINKFMSTTNQKLTNEQKQNLKKYAVFGLMTILCIAFIWFIFKPSASDREERQSGINTEIPDPRNEGLIGDRREAYEHEQIQRRQAERMRSLHDFSALLSETDTQQAQQNELSLLADETPTTRTNASRQTTTVPSQMQNSMNAHHDISRTLGSFYTSPQHDPERERLQRELDDLQRRLDDRESEQNAVDLQMALMERSLQMVAQHFPAGMMPENNETEQQPTTETGSSSRGATVVPAGQSHEQIVSALPQEMSTEAFIEAFSQPRNMRFYTATSSMQAAPRNTIAAVVHTDQSVANGENVRLRITEAMWADNILIPRNSLLSGTARIQGERLQIAISSIEYGGTIFPVDIAVFDTDGQRGIFIPNAHELNAAKEIVANMGTSAGTSINLSTNASEQFIADMGRNAVQGISQMFSRRMREVRVGLKAGYRVLLLPNDR